MADEIRVTDQTTTPAAGMPASSGADVDVTIVPERPVAAPVRPVGDAGDPSAARASIEQTRARMSETIDEIEEVLVRKKEALQDRLDVFAPVRERPLATVGMVFGAGLLLGLITGGGGDDDSDRDYRRHAAKDDELEERAATWEHRARRLLRIAREQEEELESLSGPRGKTVPRDWDDADQADDSGPSRLDHFQDELGERIGSYVTGAVRALFGTEAANG